MDEAPEAHGDGDTDSLLKKRLAATPAANEESQVGQFRRRRSSGLLFQVRRRKPRSRAKR
ncbi:MAG TPA: hypothetical protein VF990_02585 [Candidatus Dormibacteraeota bacterium]